MQAPWISAMTIWSLSQGRKMFLFSYLSEKKVSERGIKTSFRPKKGLYHWV